MRKPRIENQPSNMTCGAITNRRLYKYGTGAGGKYEGNEGATQEPEKTRKDE